MSQEMLERYRTLWTKPQVKNEEEKNEGTKLEKGAKEIEVEIEKDNYEPSPFYKNKRTAKCPISKEENGSYLKNSKLTPQKE